MYSSFPFDVFLWKIVSLYSKYSINIPFATPQNQRHVGSKCQYDNFSLVRKTYTANQNASEKNPVSSIYIWSKNFSHSSKQESEAKDGEIEGAILRQFQSPARQFH